MVNWIGLTMIIVAVGGLMWVYLPLGVAEARYFWGKSEMAKISQQVQVNLKGSKLEQTVKEISWEVPDNRYSVYIPKIGAVSRVIGNVDAGNEKMYSQALKQGVAEAAGLAHPGQVGTTFLFAHSVGSRADYARYNAVFYLLDKLNIGDMVEIVYMGKLYKYEAVNKEILAADDTKYLIPQTQEEKLVLQTCYPPGTSSKRLVVVGKRVI